MLIIEMEDGRKIELELAPDSAPNTVKNFLYLANRGYYDGLIFHRVIKGFMIQGGCPEGSGSGGPGYYIRGEFSGNGVANPLHHRRGVISMARASHQDSAGSQFFIMHEDGFFLDGQYAAFGWVTQGMEVVDEIAAVPTDGRDRPRTEQKIKSITLVDEGPVEEPEKISRG
ncbi:MAG: peptidylprolyl isomerase [Clostridia bacterium]|nr:peptidylprolyl isomerase [Clostridia bacterium]